MSKLKLRLESLQCTGLTHRTDDGENSDAQRHASKVEILKNVVVGMGHVAWDKAKKKTGLIVLAMVGTKQFLVYLKSMVDVEAIDPFKRDLAAAITPFVKACKLFVRGFLQVTLLLMMIPWWNYFAASSSHLNLFGSQHLVYHNLLPPMIIMLPTFCSKLFFCTVMVLDC